MTQNQSLFLRICTHLPGRNDCESGRKGCGVVRSLAAAGSSNRPFCFRPFYLPLPPYLPATILPSPSLLSSLPPLQADASIVFATSDKVRRPPSFFSDKFSPRTFFTLKRLQLFGHNPDVPTGLARPPPPPNTPCPPCPPATHPQQA